jgi:hypothetical protein
MKFTVFSRRTYWKSAAARWKQRYFWGGEWSQIAGGSSQAVYTKLLSAQSADDVDKAIGNDTWTSIDCEVCRTRKPVSVVHLQDMDGFDGIYVCLSCLEKAAKPLRKEEQK